MKKIVIFWILCLPLIVLGQHQNGLIEQIQSNPDKIESASAILRVGGNNPDYKQLEALYKTLNRKVRKSIQGKLAKRHIDALKKSAVGKKAPGITQFDLSGAPYSLQDLRGKYVLVSFWSSQNTASRQEIPLYKEIYAALKDHNFEILAVSFDTEFSTWEAYIQENELTWKHISDLQGMNNGAALGYGIRALPQNILVSPEGIILARNLRGDTLKKKLYETIN